MKTALSFDDILLYPQHGIVKSREEVNPGTKIGEWHMRLPIFSSPMETVTGVQMAIALGRQGCIGVLHRYGTKMLREGWAESLKKLVPMPVAMAFSMRDDDIDFSNADILVMDVAHADCDEGLRLIERMRKFYPDKIIVAGSVATSSGTRRLIDAGADILRVGIGSGAACTTRTKTGFGVPMVTSIEECSFTARSLGKKVIADGGIKNSGDVVKALAVGADYVMLGRMFAGTREAPLGRQYFGQASIKSSAYNGKYEEGAYGEVEDQGSVEDVLAAIEDGLRSGISYGGGKDIDGMRAKVGYQVVTPLTMVENNVRI